jgi:hypothetical protein
MNEAKYLNINPFIDGFDTYQINCVDITLAGALSLYNYDNFFYYCFYIGVMSNWLDTSNKPYFDYRNVICKKMGLYIRPNIFIEYEKLLEFVRESINNNIPLVFLSNHSTCYYTPAYLSGDKTKRAFIISGYNKYKGILTLNDLFPFFIYPIKKIINADPLYCIIVTEDIFRDIWQKTNKYFAETGNFNLNTIYSIEKISQPQINNYGDLLDDFLSNYDFSHDQLFKLITNYGDFNEEHDAKTNLRLNLYGSLEAFFRSIEKMVVSLDSEKHTFCELKSRYMSNRNTILSALLEQKTPREKVNKEHYINDIRYDNDALMKYLIDLAKKLKGN